MIKKVAVMVCAFCLQGCVHTLSEATEAAALLIVAIPVGVVTAPIWIPSAIIGANEAQIKRGQAKATLCCCLESPRKPMNVTMALA